MGSQVEATDAAAPGTLHGERENESHAVIAAGVSWTAPSSNGSPITGYTVRGEPNIAAAMYSCSLPSKLGRLNGMSHSPAAVT
jgi:hypothetical protein